jgi:hypothetical protein
MVADLLVTGALARCSNEVDATSIQSEHLLYRTLLSLRQQQQPILIPDARMRQFVAERLRTELLSIHTSHTIPSEDKVPHTSI